MNGIMKTKGRFFLKSTISAIPEAKPVVFFDTCALLEILRLPGRSIDPGRDFEQYMYMAEKISSGDLIPVTSELVFQEFNQHYFDEFITMKKWEQDKRDAVKRLTALMVNGKKRTRIEKAISEIHTETNVTSTISQIWRNTILIREEKRFLEFAYHRVKYKQAPSQNKEQFKDSYIWGTFLNLAHSLVTNPLFYFTLNKKDYLEIGTNKLCSDIETDLKILPNVKFHYVLGSLYGDLTKLIP